jgi:hypothetical protein
MADQKQITCPFCTGTVLPKLAARPFLSLNGFLQRNFGIQIPSTAFSTLLQNVPIPKKALFLQGCTACGGKGTIPDPSDDSAKYSKVAALAQQHQPEIEKNEALATGCNRYTIIQGSDLLEVGLGMNTTPSYRVDKDKGIRNARLADPSEINTTQGGPQIPIGATANHVQGTNPLASPGGQYVIKCSNKFSLLVGAQGVDITTGGPVNIHGGITSIIGPEVTVGSSTGRLLLEGETVVVNGKSIEVTPSDGHLFVRGTISNTGNLVTAGHIHAESMSVVKLDCVGKNQTTTISGPGNLMTGPAFWGPSTALVGTLLDISSNITQQVANPDFATQLTSIRGALAMSEGMVNLAYAAVPFELSPCGVAYNGATAYPVFLFPHVHALPDLRHTHEVRVPDFSLSDTADEVRNSQAGVTDSAPLHKQSSSALQAAASLISSIGTAFTAIRSSTQNNLFSKHLG